MHLHKLSMHVTFFVCPPCLQCLVSLKISEPFFFSHNVFQQFKPVLSDFKCVTEEKIKTNLFFLGTGILMCIECDIVNSYIAEVAVKFLVYVSLGVSMPREIR